MEDKNKNNSDKNSSQVVIITPDEFAKLGILESLSRKTEISNEKINKSSAITTKKSPFKKDPIELLKYIFTQETDFKKSKEPTKSKKTKDKSNTEKIPETITNEFNLPKNSLHSETNLVKNIQKSPVGLEETKIFIKKKIANTANSSVESNRHGLSKINTLSTSLVNLNTNKKNVPVKKNRIDSKKVSIISEKLVNFGTEEINTIVAKSSPPNLNKTLIHSKHLAAKPTNSILDTPESSSTPEIKSSFSKSSSRKYILNKSQVLSNFSKTDMHDETSQILQTIAKDAGNSNESDLTKKDNNSNKTVSKEIVKKKFKTLDSFNPKTNKTKNVLIEDSKNKTTLKSDLKTMDNFFNTREINIECQDLKSIIKVPSSTIKLVDSEEESKIKNKIDFLQKPLKGKNKSFHDDNSKKRCKISRSVINESNNSTEIVEKITELKCGPLDLRKEKVETHNLNLKNPELVGNKKRGRPKAVINNETGTSTKMVEKIPTKTKQRNFLKINEEFEDINQKDDLTNLNKTEVNINEDNSTEIIDTYTFKIGVTANNNKNITKVTAPKQISDKLVENSLKEKVSVSKLIHTKVQSTIDQNDSIQNIVIHVPKKTGYKTIYNELQNSKTSIEEACSKIKLVNVEEAIKKTNEIDSTQKTPIFKHKLFPNINQNIRKRGRPKKISETAVYKTNDNIEKITETELTSESLDLLEQIVDTKLVSITLNTEKGAIPKELIEAVINDEEDNSNNNFDKLSTETKLKSNKIDKEMTKYGAVNELSNTINFEEIVAKEKTNVTKLVFGSVHSTGDQKNSLQNVITVPKKSSYKILHNECRDTQTIIKAPCNTIKLVNPIEEIKSIHNIDFKEKSLSYKNESFTNLNNNIPDSSFQKNIGSPKTVVIETNDSIKIEKLTAEIDPRNEALSLIKPNLNSNTVIQKHKRKGRPRKVSKTVVNETYDIDEMVETVTTEMDLKSESLDSINQTPEINKINNSLKLSDQDSNKILFNSTENPTVIPKKRGGKKDIFQSIIQEVTTVKGSKIEKILLKSLNKNIVTSQDDFSKIPRTMNLKDTVNDKEESSVTDTDQKEHLTYKNQIPDVLKTLVSGDLKRSTDDHKLAKDQNNSDEEHQREIKNSNEINNSIELETKANGKMTSITDIFKDKETIEDKISNITEDSEDEKQQKTFTYKKRLSRSRIPWRKNVNISTQKAKNTTIGNLKSEVELIKNNDLEYVKNAGDFVEDLVKCQDADPKMGSNIVENTSSKADCSTIEKIFTENSEPPIKKKRGRKPKSESVKVSSPDPKIELPMEESKRGRRYVKINYLDLGGLLDDDTEFDSGEENKKKVEANESTTEINTTVDSSFNHSNPIPKKRGRPRKTISTKCITLFNKNILDVTAVKKSESNLIENEVKNDEFEVQNSDLFIKNKMGRTRKSSSHSEHGDIEQNNKKPENNLNTADRQANEDNIQMKLSENNILDSSDPPLKKKRGRPKKTQNLIDSSDLSFNEKIGLLSNLNSDEIQNNEFQNQTLDDEMSNSCSPFKKKQELDLTTYNCEKPSTALGEEINSLPSTSFEIPVIKKKVGRKPKGEQPKYILEEKDHELQIIKSKRERKHVKGDLDIENILSEEIQPSKKIKRLSSPEIKDSLEDSDVSNASEEVKRVKYSQTGSYSKMMSDVFLAASLKSEPTEENSSVSSKAKVGRRKRNEESFFHVNDNGEVTCALCHDNLSVDNWNNHNESKHNNLSWRVGDHVINLDQRVAKDKLKDFLSKNKSLTCLKCSQIFTKITDFVLHSEECMGIVKEGYTTCAVCNNSILKKAWLSHKLKHNNLAWRIGDHALNLKNEAFVLQTLNSLYKAKKPLYCDKCQVVKKSVIGLLSHMAQCGNTEEVKVACEVCGRKMLPVSIPYHTKSMHETPKNVPARSSYFDVDINLVQTKRNASRRAMAIMDGMQLDNLEIFKHFVKQMDFEEDKSIIKFLNNELEVYKTLRCQIRGCEFCCDETSCLLSHMSACPLKPDQHYTCKICFTIEPSEEEIIKHLTSTHNIKTKHDVDYVYNEINYDEDEKEFEDDFNIKSRRSSKMIRRPSSELLHKPKPRFIQEVKGSCKPSNFLFSNAFDFSLHFNAKHFCHEVLFEYLKCEKSCWSLIEEEFLENYLPTLQFSCDVANKKGKLKIIDKEQTFKKYELFETEQEEDHVTIFCGGPVLCQAWLPTPYTSSDQIQILAVATGKDLDGNYKHNENYSESTSIQFWNFGLLKNRAAQPEPKLEFCLGVDIGPIWHLEWCPSGCFNAEESVEWSRAGLLAVAGCSMSVHIYSIPLIKEDNKGVFYKAKPVLQLQVTMDANYLKRKIFPTKIAWNKVSKHDYIAVGYTDGTVALYNLNTTSNLLKISSDILLPYKIIKAHTHYISAVFWIPIDEGNRWLVTTSFDKTSHIWDLYNDDKLFSKKCKMICDAAWLTYWLSYISVSDESSALVGQTLATVTSHRGYLFDFCNISGSTSTISSVSASDWLNGFVHGNETGEICAFFPQQMILDMGNLKKLKNYRFITGCTVLIDKTLPPKERAATESKQKEALKYNIRKNLNNKRKLYEWYEPLEYKEAAQRYGVVFCDMNELQKIITVTSDSEWSKPNMYPLQAINKICFNPNRQASLYYATGYQIGFVRLSYLKFLEEDEQINESILAFNS